MTTSSAFTRGFFFLPILRYHGRMSEQLKHILPLISARMHLAMEEHVMPGGVVGVVTARGERIVLPFGR